MFFKSVFKPGDPDPVRPMVGLREKNMETLKIFKNLIPPRKGSEQLRWAAKKNVEGKKDQQMCNSIFCIYTGQILPCLPRPPSVHEVVTHFI